MENHQTLRNLSPELRPTIISWIEAAIEDDLSHNPKHSTSIVSRVVECMESVIYPEGEFEDYISEEELLKLQEWDNTVEDEDWTVLVGDIFHSMLKAGRVKMPTPQLLRTATESQLQIIRELQEDEPDIRFDFCFPQLTSWMAHVIIQGLVAMSEVQRNTGRREFRPGELRRAIRVYLQESRR